MEEIFSLFGGGSSNTRSNPRSQNGSLFSNQLDLTQQSQGLQQQHQPVSQSIFNTTTTTTRVLPNGAVITQTVSSNPNPQTQFQRLRQLSQDQLSANSIQNSQSGQGSERSTRSNAQSVPQANSNRQNMNSSPFQRNA